MGTQPYTSTAGNYGITPPSLLHQEQPNKFERSLPTCIAIQLSDLSTFTCPHREQATEHSLSLHLIPNKQLESVFRYISSTDTVHTNMIFNTPSLWFLFVFGCSSLAHTVSGPEYDSPYGGPPAEYFASSKSSLVSALKHAISKVSQVPNLATYPVNREDNNPDRSTIYSDWASFDEVRFIIPNIEHKSLITSIGLCPRMDRRHGCGLRRG